MRKNMFGGVVVDSTQDDLGSIIAETGATSDELYGIVLAGDDGGYGVEVRYNDSGDEVVTSDDVFKTKVEAKAFLKDHVSVVQSED